MGLHAPSAPRRAALCLLAFSVCLLFRSFSLSSSSNMVDSVQTFGRKVRGEEEGGEEQTAEAMRRAATANLAQTSAHAFVSARCAPACPSALLPSPPSPRLLSFDCDYCAALLLRYDLLLLAAHDRLASALGWRCDPRLCCLLHSNRC